MITSLAGLETRVLQHSQTKPIAAAVFCHGYGAPGDDLVPFVQALIEQAPALANVRFFVPAAPISLGQSGWGEARAWWPLDMQTLARLQTGDATAMRQFSKAEPPGLPAARQAMLKLVDAILTQTGLPMSKLLLGGFSQGAMLATDTALRLEEAPMGLAVLSGTLLLEEVWGPKAASRAGLNVFQTHGRSDPVLPFQAATWLHDLLSRSGAKLEWHPFDGGHTIDPGAVASLGAFITRLMTA